MVDHCFSTRNGGVSQKDYQSLNLGLHVNDDQNNVVENRKIIADLMSSSLDQLVAGEQVHGTNIKVVKEKDKGRGAFNYETSFPQTDALITDRRNILLSSYYADCTPLFFLAPDIPAVALAHAGWRGTVNQIGQKTALKLQEVYGAKLNELLVGIGPHIGPCCYQVDQKVIEPLADSSKDWKRAVTEDGNNKWKLDLTKINKIQLEEIGIRSQNIIKSNLCTSCNPDVFYSYRRDRGTTGRMASLIKLR